MDLNLENDVWNRAKNGGGPNPLEGDSALAAVLRVHGLVVAGGVGHAVEALDPDDFDAAEAGLRYFADDDLADVIAEAGVLAADEADSDPYDDDDEEDSDDEAEVVEEQDALEDLDERYDELVPSDQHLLDLFAKRFRESPDDFSPLP